MGHLHLTLDGEGFEFDDTNVYYLIDAHGRLDIRTTPPPADGAIRELGHFVSVLGHWFFRTVNVPAVRRLRIDGEPIVNPRTEIRSESAVMTGLVGVSTGPASLRDRPPSATTTSIPPTTPIPPTAPTGDADSGRRDKVRTIGRLGSRADIEIDDPLVMMEHATFRIDGLGRWSIRGPIFVGGVRQMLSTLVEGDVFVIGQTSVTVSMDLLTKSATPATVVGPRRRLDPTRRPTDETGLGVEVVGVTVYGSGGRKRLDNVSLTIAPREVVAIVGPSGAGKSSLIKLLLGELAEDAGSVRIGPDKSRPTGKILRRKQVKHVPQGDGGLYPTLTVFETLRYAARLRAAPDTTDDTIDRRVIDVMGRLTLDGVRDSEISRLSGGQKRRVSIGTELVGEPKLLLLDEPTSGLDAGKDRGIMADLPVVSDVYRCTVIVVTHATEHLGYVDRVLLVRQGGRIVDAGPPAGILSRLGFASWADLMIDLDSPPAEVSDVRAAVREPGRPERPRMELATKGFATILSRQWTVTKRRGAPWIATLFAIPLICTVIAIWASKNGLAPGADMTSVLGILITLTALTGASLSYLDLVAEREILNRDWRSGIEVVPILMSKVVVFGGLCAALSGVMSIVFATFRHLPPGADGLAPLLMLWAVLFLVMLASMGIGLLISACAANLEKAVTWSTFLAILQVLLNGSLFRLKWSLQYVTVLLPARLGLAGIASYADLNSYRQPRVYTDWMWWGGPVRFWAFLAGLLAIFILSIAGAMFRTEVTWQIPPQNEPSRRSTAAAPRRQPSVPEAGRTR